MNTINEKINFIVEQWQKDKDRYLKLKSAVDNFFENNITEIGILPYISSRIKKPISLVKTAIHKNKEYTQIKDKLGFRIVCNFKNDIPKINGFIEKYFIVNCYESKAEKLNYDKLGYTSDHFEVKLNPCVDYFKAFENLFDLDFEIQVRTTCQHAWADVEHGLSYKQDIELTEIVKRKIFRLSTLFEISDDEFDKINDFIIEQPEYSIFKLVRLLESHFYIFAKRSFDRNFTYYNISNLFNDFIKDIENSTLLNEIENFIKTNENKIKSIFDQRSEMLDNEIFISQPEIFLIWFQIEKHKNSFEKNWNNLYTFDDLQKLAVIWGNPYFES